MKNLLLPTDTSVVDLQTNASTCIEQINPYRPWKNSLLALCLSNNNWPAAVQTMEMVFATQQIDGRLPFAAPYLECSDNIPPLTQAPIQAYVIWKLHKNAPNKAAGISLLAQFFPKLLAQQDYFYSHRDPLDDGLISIISKVESPGSLGMTPRVEDQVSCSIQDPAFNGFVTLSNEYLINIGSLLGVDILKPILWNELTLHAFKEKLWSTKTECYQYFDIDKNQTGELPPLDSFLTLFGRVPDHETAESFFKYILGLKGQKECLKTNFEQSLLGYTSNALSPISTRHHLIPADRLWLIQKGLKRYEMKKIAKKLRKKIAAKSPTGKVKTIHSFCAEQNQEATYSTVGLR